MSPDADEKSQRIGSALSGGGVRTAAFHAEVLQYLASRGKLEKVVWMASIILAGRRQLSWPVAE